MQAQSNWFQFHLPCNINEPVKELYLMLRRFLTDGQTNVEQILWGQHSFYVTQFVMKEISQLLGKWVVVRWHGDPWDAIKHIRGLIIPLCLRQACAGREAPKTYKTVDAEGQDSETLLHRQQIHGFCFPLSFCICRVSPLDGSRATASEESTFCGYSGVNRLLQWILIW